MAETIKKIVAILPHGAVYGGVKRYVESGNEMIKMGIDFAIHEETALINGTGDIEGFVWSAARILGDTELRARLISKGTEKIKEFS